jgi:hypothetical protein
VAVAVRLAPINELMAWLHGQLGDVGTYLVLAVVLLIALAVALAVIIGYRLYENW